MCPPPVDLNDTLGCWRKLPGCGRDCASGVIAEQRLVRLLNDIGRRLPGEPRMIPARSPFSAYLAGE